ncbi:MAG: hypothetical protein ACRDZ4_00900 [Egibacteraceae bacterium]
MPLIADYVILSDDFFVLEKAGAKENLLFTLPSSAHLDSPAILFFKVVSLDPVDLKFRVFVNGSEQQWAKYSAGAVCSLHEVVEGLNAGDNTVTFEFQSGEGTLRIGDVALWFKREQ